MIPKEIGSHFEYQHNYKENYKREQGGKWFKSQSDHCFTFSGRTAIEIALKDIMLDRTIKTVYMPSYVCDSMIQPFLKFGIDILFYDVDYNLDSEKGFTVQIDKNVKCDIFFTMKYFGLEAKNYDLIFEEFKSNNTIIIEDTTHSYFTDQKKSQVADYNVASIRKWLGIASGGFISKRDGILHVKPTQNSDHLVVEKIQAMKCKRAYLDGKLVDKSQYFTLFNTFENKLLDSDYRMKIDSFSKDILTWVSIDKMRTQRVKNSLILYKEIIELNFIEPVFKEHISNELCPLYVPVIVTNGKRDELRSYLIKEEIFCPVHWPQGLSQKSNIPSLELSLICDQRYNEEDMIKITNLLKKWDSKQKAI